MRTSDIERVKSKSTLGFKSYKIISLEFIKSKKNITAERVISKLGFKKNKNTTVYDLNVDDIAVNSNIKVKFLERFDK